MVTEKTFAAAWTNGTSVRTALLAIWLVASSAGAAPDLAQLSDVFARALEVQSELETLRFHMGKPEVTPPVITASGVAPHEAYFQALALFHNANQLCFEHTGQLAQAPAMPLGSMRPADVYVLVDASLERIVRARRTFDRAARPVEHSVDTENSPTDLFNVLVQCNRQLNLLLDSRVAPREVFSQVTLATAYTALLLEPFPEFDLLPAAPAFEAGKRPVDVFQRLLTCLDRIRMVAQTSGVPMLDLTVDKEQLSTVEPSDVHHLESLVVAELAQLHSRLEGAHAPPELYQVGRKVPSDVYQRVGMLERQLATLQRYVQSQPDWLERSAEK